MCRRDNGDCTSYHPDIVPGLPRIPITMRPSAGTPIMALSWSWSPYTGSSTGPSGPGMLRRTRRPRSPSSGLSGGLPRPSWLWHEEQDRALWVGPSPSLATVLAGAVTPILIKETVAYFKDSTQLIREVAGGKFKSVDAITESSGISAQADIKDLVKVHILLILPACNGSRDHGRQQRYCQWPQPRFNHRPETAHLKSADADGDSY